MNEERSIESSLAETGPSEMPVVSPDMQEDGFRASIVDGASLRQIDSGQSKETLSPSVKEELSEVTPRQQDVISTVAMGNPGAAYARPNGKIEFLEPQLWPKPVDGAAVLDQLVAIVNEQVICDINTARATALWIVFTWLTDFVRFAPIAMITAPERRCGKSRLLNLMGYFAQKPLPTSNISAAALFRLIDSHQPTLLVDEADTFMPENADLRGILNAGHTRSTAYITRCVGDAHEPVRHSVWGAKAIAGIGKFPDTITDRSIVLELKRKLPSEEVAPLVVDATAEFIELNAQIARFAKDHGGAVKVAETSVDFPKGLHDRAKDNWAPLLAIAYVVGGEWYANARAAAQALSYEDDFDEESDGVQLLMSLQRMCDQEESSALPSAEIITRLCFDQRWATYNKGKPLTAIFLARLLKKYGIKPRNIVQGNLRPKGYVLAELKDVYERYLTEPDSAD